MQHLACVWPTLCRCDTSVFTVAPDAVYSPEVHFDTPPISAAAYLFDGVAAIALAADAALKAQGANGTDHEVGGEALLNALLGGLEFDGASGRVAFDDNGDRDPATIDGVRFALGNLAPNMTNITYIVVENGTSMIDATRGDVLTEWIDGDSKQPPDAYRSEVCVGISAARAP